MADHAGPDPALGIDFASDPPTQTTFGVRALRLWPGKSCELTIIVDDKGRLQITAPHAHIDATPLFDGTHHENRVVVTFGECLEQMAGTVYPTE